MATAEDVKIVVNGKAVDGAAAWTAERWARAMFEDRRPLPARLLASGPLGLVLTGPRPPGRVAGWGIAANTARRLVLTRDLVVAREAVVVDVEDDAVAVLTAIALRPAPVRLATPPLDVLHRVVTPAVLGRAHAQLAAAT